MPPESFRFFIPSCSSCSAFETEPSIGGQPRRERFETNEGPFNERPLVSYPNLRRAYFSFIHTSSRTVTGLLSVCPPTVSFTT